METEKKPNQKSQEQKTNLYYIFVGLAVLLVIIVIMNISIVFNLDKEINKKADLSKEAQRPANVELTVIKNSKCKDCFDASTVVGYIKSSKVNVTKETSYEFDSNQGKQLISKYGIEKIPSIILTGEVAKVDVKGLVKKDDALLFSDALPPFTNTKTGNIEGRVTLYKLYDSQCTKCNDISIFISQIKVAGVKIVEQQNISSESIEGKDMLKKYNIAFLPAVIMSKDASAYKIIQDAWPQVGSVESDGSYVLRTASPPFINLTTGELRGIVDITYLTDKSCTDCYDVNQHREILTSPQSFAMHLGKEEVVDIKDAKGKELVASFNITKVPTVILSREASVYPSSQFLKQFFSIEKNGYFVFRKVETVGTYKDLTTNQVVSSKQSAQA